MDLRGIANGCKVAPSTEQNRYGSPVDRLHHWRRPQASSGYADSVTGPAQIQALDANDIKQLDGLNIQGTVRAIYLRGVLAGVVRPDGTGGDLIQRPANGRRLGNLACCQSP